MADANPKLSHERGYLAMVATIALLLAMLLIVAVIPVSFASIIDDIFGTGNGKTYRVSFSLGEGVGGQAEAESLALDIGVTSLDELSRIATLRVTGERVCASGCTTTHQLVLTALRDPGTPHVGRPPAVAVTLPPHQSAVNQTLHLPVIGHPIRYPFDTYELRLAFSHDRVLEDGSSVAVPPAQDEAHLAVTIEEELPRLIMAEPVGVEPQAVGPSRGGPYLAIEALTFYRPLYLQVLSVLLIFLIGIAAIYTVVRRSLSEFFINFGGVVVGIWGVRSILVPGTTAYVTSVDLALSAVILFMLGSVIVRTLVYFHRRSGLPPHRDPS